MTHAARAIGRGAGRLLPRSMRLRVSAARAAALSARTRWQLRRLAASGRPIVAGPYLGEVGFELLYWIPFLAWFTERYAVPAGRIVAASRGGTAPWYAHLASTYVDVFETMEPAEFRRRNEERVRELGEQKQIAIARFDGELLGAITRRVGGDPLVLHPSVMYALFAPFWWGHLPIRWIDAHTRFRRLAAPQLPEGLSLPENFAAVKFYFNDCFVDAPATRALVPQAVRAAAGALPIVSLSTGLPIDDHGPCDPHERDQVIRPRYEASTNLGVQSAIVARARRFVGTYGGFAYLSPFYGVPATAYYTDPQGYSQRHLDVARLAIARMDGGALDVRHLDAVAAPAEGLACSAR